VLSETIEPTEDRCRPNDDHRHAERGDGDNDGLPRHQLDVRRPEERGPDSAEDQRDDDEAGEHASDALPPRRRRAVMTRLAPNASINSACSVHSPPPAPTEPAARHTAMRSQTPSSS
jgi:hypothetical protein